MSHAKSNRLSNETSPYLLQHAHNPVDWYAWNDEALQKAVNEDKPIFLSIGYSACHWCHVMAHESFEDDDTATIMNAHFINIKVDKEERPDLDKIYQIAQLMLTQRSGGWPLSMFLTPDQAPFFGGIYFPPTARHGLPGFKDILFRIADIYQHQREMINNQNHTLLAALRKMDKQDNNGMTLDMQPIDTATEQLYRNFDAQFGGFGNAPKFPQTPNLEFLLRQSIQAKHNHEKMLQILDFTLHKMIIGGLYDQLGGGFYRYTIDREWMIPHFEKMLYDNGLLLTLCSQAWQVIQKPLLKKAVYETADWVIREMQDPAGGYYSSLDADSEGVEGKFYIWTPHEVAGVLDQSEYTVFAKHYGIDQAANFESAWHLYLAQEPENHDISLIEQARGKLLQHRSQRIRPHCDDKILTAWNALMIKGIATAGFIFGKESYVDSAERALSFIDNNLYNDGCLLATYRNGKAHLNAYLDDYAFMIDALLTFLQCRWHSRWLDMAISLADKLLESFSDQQQGGFFFTANNHETLICRSKYFTDDSFSSGNGVAASSLNKLGHLIGEQRYLDAAESALKSALPIARQQPLACSTLLNALQETLQPPRQIIVFADADNAETWRDKYRSNHNSCDSFMILPPSITNLPGQLSQYNIEQSPVAYICSAQRCQEPIFDADLLANHLHNTPS